MKKLLTIVLCVVLAISCMGILSACKKTNPEDEHTHSYATGWTSDEKSHWHKATCQHTTEVSGKEAHTFNQFNRCTVCDYQGEISYGNGGIDSAESWKTAIQALAKMRNFTASKLTESEDGDSELITLMVMENVIYQGISGYYEVYQVYTENSITEYYGYDGMWMSSETEETDENQFDEDVADLIESLITSELEGLDEAYELFQYNDTLKAYVAGESDGEEYYEVKFVGSSVYSIKKVITGDDQVETIILDKVGNTSFEIEPLHKHDYSTVWSANNVYHWHDAVCHEGELDVKVVHSWDKDNKCTVCGYAKAAVKSQVASKDVFASALQLKGLINWSVTVKDGEGKTNVALTRDGNKVYTLSDETMYIELTESSLWQYFQNADGVWEKRAADGSDGISADTFETLLSYMLRPFANLAELWDDLTLVNGSYTASGCQPDFDEPFDFGFENATVSITLDDGEVVAFTVTEMDGDDVVLQLTFEIGTASITLPSAKEHVHNFTANTIDRYYHSMRCYCGEYVSGDHDYDENVEGSVCSVCGAKNHEHVYDHYAPYEYEPNNHRFVCECGVRSSNTEQCEYADGSDVCVKCGEKRHVHSGVYDEEQGWYYDDQHTLICDECGTYYWEDHIWQNGKCTVCGCEQQ